MPQSPPRQPHDTAAGAGLGHQNGVDLGLGGGGAKAFLADIDPRHMGRDQRQHLIADQPVMDDHIRPGQRLIGSQRQMPGSTRPGPHEGDGNGRLGGRAGRAWRTREFPASI